MPALAATSGQQPDEGDKDWLSALAASIPVLGSFLSFGSNEAHKATTGRYGAPVTPDVTPQVMGALGTGMGWASDKDPTKLLSGPVLSALHGVGVGKQGDEWDKGALGLLGTGFSKGGSLLTYAALKGTLGSWGDGSVGMGATFQGGRLNQKAWDLAFDKEAPVDFGAAMLADSSVLTDPDGLTKLHKEMDSTWYGNVLAGSLTFMGYSAVDPTRGAGKVLKAGRAANYVPNVVKADALAGVINKALPNEEAAAGATLAGTKAGAQANKARALVGRPLDDVEQAGHLMVAMGRFDGDTNLNSVMNKLDPTLGSVNTQARLAFPVAAEMIADLGHIKDIGLQRQAKLNVQLALTGGGDSMKWLADNVPMIAAKGKRASTAPSEFTLLRNVMDDVEANGLESLDVGKWVDSHYGTAANASELKAYGSKVEDVRKFKQTIEHGGADGGVVEFGSTGTGVQLAPRTLEILKTGINQRIVDSHLLQGGASGRTIRVVNNFVTPHTNGFIHTQDPIRGNKQLMSTLRTFSNKMRGPDGADVITPEFIQAASETYLKASQSERTALIDSLSDTLLEKVAGKYSAESMADRGIPLSKENVIQMVREANAAKSGGRAYAEGKVKAAAAKGEGETYLGDLSGSDTVLNTAHLATQLETTRFLWDWKTANEAVDGFYKNNRVTNQSGVSRVAGATKDNTAQALAWYLRMWKHGVLMRPGLAPRAILDTGMRSVVSINAGTTALQAASGALNVARNRGGGLLGNAYDSARMTMTAADKAGAARAQGTIETLNAEGAAQGTKIMDRTLKANRSAELADSLGAKMQNKRGQFHSLSNYYRDLEQRAISLELRQRGNATVFGGDKPLGVQSLTDEFYTQAAQRKEAIGGLKAAKAKYEEGTLLSARSNAATPFAVNGHEFQLVRSDEEFAALKAEATAGGSASDMFLGEMSQDLKGMKADANHGSDHVAFDDAHWAQKYATTAATLRGSYTAKRLLNEEEALTRPARTPAAVVDSFLKDPAVLAEYRSLSLPTTVEGTGVMVRGEHLSETEMTAWLSQVADSVKSMTANEQARALMTGAKEVTPEMANAIQGADRFPIFGPDVFRDTTKHAIDKFYNVALNMPDVALARVPMVNGLYRANVRELVATYEARATAQGRKLNDKELGEIHTRGMQRALNDVRRDMYDVHRNVGAHGVMSMISPFFAPWEDAMMSWGRLLYDDPSRLGKLMLYSQTADIFHVSVDANGNPTKPFDGTAMQDKYINIPLAGLGGLESMRANVGSLNSIQQGNVPFSPGAGPLVQLGATAMMAGLLQGDKVGLGQPGAELWDAIASNPDNLFNKTIFPQGEPPKSNATSIITSQMPSYLRKLADAVFSTSDFSVGSVYPTAYGTRYGDLIRQYREANGGKDPSAAQLKVMQGQASNGARVAGIASAAMSWGIGISGNAAPEGQLYVDKMHALNQMTPALAEQGLTPGGVFATMYPNAARLNWSFSVNEGKLEATVNATSAYYKHRSLMDANREAGWWIAGADNILANLNDPDTAGKTFSQAAYNQQMNAGLRRRYNAKDLVERQDVAMGYGRMAQYDSALSLYMRENGIKSLNSANAGQLGAMKRQYTAELRTQFPDWARDQDSMDLGKRARQIEQIATIAANPPAGLRDRPDVLTTQKYLFARQSLADNASQQGVTSWQTAKNQLANRYALHQYGQTLAAGDIVFQAAWSRLFEQEFKADLAPMTGS